MKLWGSRDDRDGDDRRPGSSSSLPRASVEADAPNEHTRLLPNRVESTSYLSPDDPAVRISGGPAAGQGPLPPFLN